MKILRDDVVIELKKEDIHRAYRQYLYEMDKELVKSRLMDFLFEDEYESIEDIEAFYDEATVEFRKNSVECDTDLEEALRDAILLTADKYIHSKNALCKDCSAEKLDKYECYEYRFVMYQLYNKDSGIMMKDHVHANEFVHSPEYTTVENWAVNVIAKGTKYLFVLSKEGHTAMYLADTVDKEDIVDENTMLEYMDPIISDWVAAWEYCYSNIEDEEETHIHDDDGVLHRRRCYEITIPDAGFKWNVFVIKKEGFWEFTLCDPESNVRYWAATVSAEDLYDEESVLDYITENMPEWGTIWETRYMDIE